MRALRPDEQGLSEFLFRLSTFVAGELEDLEPAGEDARRNIGRFLRSCSEAFGRGNPPQENVTALNKCLFQQAGLQPVPDDDDIRHFFPHDVLRNSQGPCLPLSALYLIAAEELGLPVHGVLVPGHFFVRYDDGCVRINIETLKKGVSIPDRWYIQKYRVPRRAKAYLRSLSNEETAAVYLFNAANFLDNRGKEDIAESLYRQAIDLFPTFAEAHGNLGVIFLKRGDVDEAIAEFRHSVDFNPLLRGAYLNLGAALQAKGELKEALGAYRNGLSVEPRSPHLLHAAGTLYHRQGAMRKAVSFYKKAISVQPDFRPAHRDLARAFESMGRHAEASEHRAKAAATPTTASE